MVITLEALINIISEEISAIYSEAFDTDVDWVLGYDTGSSRSQNSHLQHSNKVLQEIEPYQKTVTAKHPKAKKRLLGFGRVRDSSTPYRVKISFKRGKSAPPIG